VSARGDHRSETARSREAPLDGRRRRARAGASLHRWCAGAQPAAADPALLDDDDEGEADVADVEDDEDDDDEPEDPEESGLVPDEESDDPDDVPPDSPDAGDEPADVLAARLSLR
jgi:hypothetical protein